MIYKWNGYAYKVPAQKVGEEIEKIEAAKGAVTRQSVLEAALDENNVLHSLFEWDDTKAAEQYRLKQASTLLSNLHIVTEKGKTVRAVVNIRINQPSTEGTFINIKKAMEEATTRDTVLRNALAEYQAVQRKYDNLIEFENVNAAIEEAAERIEGEH